MFQVCPKCNGQKHVWTPPWVPGDQLTYTTNAIVSYPCTVCGGAGVLAPPIRSTRCMHGLNPAFCTVCAAKPEE